LSSVVESVDSAVFSLLALNRGDERNPCLNSSSDLLFIILIVSSSWWSWGSSLIESVKQKVR